MIVMVVFAISSLLQIISVRAFSFSSTGSVDGNNTFECNANITLVCKTDKTPVNIVLGINGTQAVVCLDTCYENTLVLGRFSPKHNSTIGLINLHLPYVTEKDQATLFTCHEGLSVFTIQPKIKVYPKRNEIVMVINVVDNAVKINVATGCVLLERNISFVWSIIKDVPNGVSQPFATHNFTQTDTEGSGKCKPDENCGATGKSSEISFMKEHDGTGESYYVQCTVVVPDEYAPETIHLVSDRTFYLDKTESTTNSTVTLTPTPTNVITPTPPPVITPTLTVVISPTPTTVVSPTSAIVVASSSTGKTTLVTKHNLPSTPASNKSVIIAAVTGGCVILIIIVSVCVCYKKRKTRNEMKATKYISDNQELNAHVKRM